MQVMIFKYAVALFIFVGICVNACHSQVIISFSVTPKKLSVNDSCTIKWKTRGTEKVFLFPIGPVPPEGAIKRTFEESTDVFLITGNDSIFHADSAYVEVTGATKGEYDTLPKLAVYEYPVYLDKGTKACNDLIQKVFNVLQDTLGFSVSKTITSSQKIFLQTRSRKAAYLLTKDDSRMHIEFKQISYLIELNKVTDHLNTVNICIKSFIQYKKKIFTTLKEESSETLYLQQNNKIKELLKKL